MQLDSAGKLLVKGSRQVSDNKHLDVSQSFDVPTDTIIEKISGRFEDGRLTLTLPKKVEEPEAKQKPISEERVKEPVQDEGPKSTVSEEKGKEPVREELKTVEEEKKDEPMHEEKPENEPMHEEKLTSPREMRHESVSEEKPTTAEEPPQHELAQKQATQYKTESKDAPISKEKIQTSEEKKDEQHAVVEEKMEGDVTQTEKMVSSATEKGKETIQKVKSKIKDICTDTSKELRRRISAWRGAEEKWLDSESLNDILENLNKNRKVIAVAVVAFSAGFYVSQKLRTRG